MILTILVSTVLAVLVMLVGAFILRGLYLLGRTTKQRDLALEGQKILLVQNRLLYTSNHILAAQNERLIEYNVAQDALDSPEDTFTGNVFPTEG